MSITGTIRVEGLDAVLANLNRQVKDIPFRTKKGMISAGFLIQREAQKMTPVDTGNLKASAFTVWGPGTGSPNKSFKGPDAAEASSRHSQVVSTRGMQLPVGNLNPDVEVGFSASYAIYVHENTMASHVKSKSGKAAGPRGGKLATRSLLKASVLGQTDLDDVTNIGEAKFLEKAIDRNQGRILETIRKEGQVR